MNSQHFCEYECAFFECSFLFLCCWDTQAYVSQLFFNRVTTENKDMVKYNVTDILEFENERKP